MLKRVIKGVVVVIAVIAGLSGCGSAMPDYPTSLSATIGAGRVYLSWTTAPGATGYNVYRGFSSGPVATKTKIASNIGEAVYTDDAVTLGTNYYYQVTALNANGETRASNEVLGAP
ncbi:MAG TPA: fibronectin type III domain-containing protein, partial [Desulfuromonadaceae bacterium]